MKVSHQAIQHLLTRLLRSHRAQRRRDPWFAGSGNTRAGPKGWARGPTFRGAEPGRRPRGLSGSAEGAGGRQGGGTTPSGGGRAAPGDVGEPMVPSTEDKGELPPRSETPAANSDETVAPDVPQTDLVLNKLEDLLKRNQVTPELEQATGMSRDEMEQFVKKMKKLDKAPAGPGREIKVKPGVDRTFDPNRTLPDLNPNARLGNRTERARGSVAQDDHSRQRSRGSFRGSPRATAWLRSL